MAQAAGREQASNRRLCSLVTIVLLLTTLVAAAHFVRMAYQVSRMGFIDTETFILQAKYFRISGELYSNPLKEGGPLDGFEPASPWYKFPPAYMLAYMPWLDMSATSHDEQAAATHRQALAICAVHVLRYLLALVVLVWLLKPPASPWFLWHGLLTGLLFTPVFESLYGLIFDNLLLCSLVLVLWLERRGNPMLSGGVLGAVATLKLYPALLLAWLPAMRCWRALLPAGLAATLLVVAGALVFGIDNSLFYYRDLLPLLLGESSLDQSGNFSPGRFFLMVLGDPAHAMRSFWVFKHLLLLVTAAVLWRTRMDCTRGPRAPALRLSALTCLLLLYLPNYWGNYQLVLLLPVLTLLANAHARDRGWVVQGLVAMLCWSLMLFATDHNGFYVPLGLGESMPLVNALAAWRPVCPLLLLLVILAVLARPVMTNRPS